MICQYEHHKEYKKEITCENCDEPMECGRYQHACRRCEPTEFEECKICGVERVYCGC